MDVDGEPVDPPEGPVFVKYNSDSGDAFLSGYGGGVSWRAVHARTVTGRSGSTGICPSICPPGGTMSRRSGTGRLRMASETNGARDVDVSVLSWIRTVADSARRVLESLISHSCLYDLLASRAGRSRASHRFHACIVAKKKCGPPKKKKWT